jgi:hypothetical protein
MRLPCQERSFRFAVTFWKLLSSHLKTNTMQKKNWVILGIIVAVLTVSPFILHSKPAPASENSTCCKKTGQPCTKTNNNTGEMLPESLSRQFIFMTAPLN